MKKLIIFLITLCSFSVYSQEEKEFYFKLIGSEEHDSIILEIEDVQGPFIFYFEPYHYSFQFALSVKKDTVWQDIYMSSLYKVGTELPFIFKREMFLKYQNQYPYHNIFRLSFAEGICDDPPTKKSYDCTALDYIIKLKGFIGNARRL